MNGANERGSTIDVARDKSSGAERDCERYAMNGFAKSSIMYRFARFFFFFLFRSDLSFAFKRTRTFIVNEILYRYIRRS